MVGGETLLLLQRGYLVTFIYISVYLGSTLSSKHILLKETAASPTPSYAQLLTCGGKIS